LRHFVAGVFRTPVAPDDQAIIQNHTRLAIRRQSLTDSATLTGQTIGRYGQLAGL
jgi:hypothetical protein